MDKNAIKLLKNFKRRFEPILKNYFEEKIHQTGKIDPTTQKAIRMIRDYTMAGGKRIRPAFLYYSYLATGGQDRAEILKISIATELFQSFALIHDDIMDKDVSRHGVDTIHEGYKKTANKNNLEKDKIHFGNSMAIVSGDMANSMAHDVIFNTNFKDTVKLKCLNKVEKIIFSTCSGQMLDIVMSDQDKTTEKQILKMHEGKTAIYTVEGPIHLGCILAEAEKSYLDLFSKFALPLGKAFQIKDDILGIFGNEKETGKKVGSDIIEGKKTLLVLKALEKGNKKQKQIIKQCLNKKNISKKELEEFRKVIRKTGSLAYSEKLARSFAKKALTALIKINFKNKEAKEFFTGIVNFIIDRKV
ncbi:MAG: polyprenyl synthetase family protein [Candidatus Paceibacterota bacterium]